MNPQRICNINGHAKHVKSTLLVRFCVDFDQVLRFIYTESRVDGPLDCASRRRAEPLTRSQYNKTSSRKPRILGCAFHGAPGPSRHSLVYGDTGWTLLVFSFYFRLLHERGLVYPDHRGQTVHTPYTEPIRRSPCSWRYRAAATPCAAI